MTCITCGKNGLKLNRNGQCNACYQREFKRRQRLNPEFRKIEYAAQKRWISRHPDYERERAKRRWKINPEPLKAATKKYLSKNPGKARQFKKSWQANNRDKYLIQMRSDVKRRKARIKGASISDFTESLWNQMKIDYGYKCFYCNSIFEQGLTQDHKLPLSRGGDHTAANIVPACTPCNSIKGIKTDKEFQDALAAA